VCIGSRDGLDCALKSVVGDIGGVLFLEIQIPKIRPIRYSNVMKQLYQVLERIFASLESQLQMHKAGLCRC
jgi:hypothetical protein